MSATKLPEDFYTRLRSRFDEARQNGPLVFTESTEIKDTVGGIDIRYTLAPALAKKPTAIPKPGDDKGEHTPELREASPWVTPDERLLVLDSYFNDKYIVVLNRFAVTVGHFLLVTKTFERQESPLSEDDLLAAFTLLRGVNKQSGQRHVAFFNCGANSGASIAHKHIQFVPLPQDFKPFPDTVDLSKFHEDKLKPRYHDNADFQHFIAPIPKDCDNGEELAMSYSRLLARVFSVFSVSKQPTPSPSYNAVFTEEWMMLTPRRHSSTEGHGVNSLGTIGLLLAKSEDELAYFQNKGPFSLLSALGFPADVDVEAGELEEQIDYTRY